MKHEKAQKIADELDKVRRHVESITAGILIRETRLSTVSGSAKIQGNTSSACKNSVASREFSLNLLLLPENWRELKRSHSAEAASRMYTRPHTRATRS